MLDESVSTAPGSYSSEPGPTNARLSNNSAPPVQQWQAGSGLGKVIVEKSQCTTDRLKRILLTEFEHIDPLDSFLGCEAAFGQLSLDYRLYRDRLSQFGEVVMSVPSSRLNPILGGKYRDSLRIRASRDPLGRSNLIEVKELQLFEGLRKIGSHIPHPAPAKEDELRQVVSIHAIWGLSTVYDTTGKSTVIGKDDDSPERWVSAKECVELAVKHRDHRFYGLPEWAAEGFSKRKALTKVNKVRKKL